MNIYLCWMEGAVMTYLPTLSQIWCQEYVKKCNTYNQIWNWFSLLLCCAVVVLPNCFYVAIWKLFSTFRVLLNRKFHITKTSQHLALIFSLLRLLTRSKGEVHYVNHCNLHKLVARYITSSKCGSTRNEVDNLIHFIRMCHTGLRIW